MTGYMSVLTNGNRRLNLRTQPLSITKSTNTIDTMNSLPANLSQAKYKKALEFAKLSSKAYDMDDMILVM